MTSSTLAQPRLDAPQAPWLSPLARELAGGRHRELLEPLRWVAEPAAVAARPGADRAALAEALAASNAAWGHPRAGDLAERLADPACRVVVTGQQAGLFGGPLYTLSKAVAAVLWARRLAETQSAVSVFWIATEDHDFAEAASIRLPTREGVEVLSLPGDADSLRPVGERSLGPGIAEVLGRLAQADDPRCRETSERLEEIYHPEARFGDAFARWLVDLLGSDCPLLLDAALPELKRQQRPWLRALVDRRGEVARAEERANRRVRDAGFELQVTPQEDTSPLFVVSDGERRRVEWVASERFSLRGLEGDWPVESLLERIDEQPETVTPGVLARPVLQDAVLGTALQVLGPGELCYMTQVAPLYEVLEVAAPAVTLRPQAVVLEPRQRDWLVELDAEGLAPARLLGRAEELEEWLARRHGPDPLADAERDLRARLDALRPQLVALDANLERPWEKTRDQVERALAALKEKTRKASARRDEILVRRLETLRTALLPAGSLQDRVLATVWFRARYGAAGVRVLFEQLELDPSVLQLITIEPAPVAAEEQDDG